MTNPVPSELVRKVRNRTSAPLLECKNALKEAKGDIDKAIEILKIKGLSEVEKKSGRNTPEGQIFSYVHAGGKIGVLVEINCETDFVARNNEFQNFAKEISMQIAASDPKFVSKDDVPQSFIDNEKKIILAQVEKSGKKPEFTQRIVEGKLAKTLEEICLINQVYIRDSKLTVEDLQNELLSKLGENIKVSRFVRYQIGETQTDG
ncbi:MAG TPA: elongation factor Ts [Candidatus Dadabacteria bacterium]|jgi:elongation factor Ts|nr:elongation factor Ts [Candidatus Dadabacteria bacterium]